ncbi:carbohydrate-binding module family 50 protein [Aaosphaeria arxii CBS 175.79]|uniref:Carbohydrate-binding module family 50 protein n=1 Tax=Aaosphaeria arxii CBS 175.79 TaxID=1450172 RepID=A0A6A5XZ89_9PLEO|nr:carbohydrate-binding module family 50 protein [Aaosphaeria arxii CBS 175.79]KAF2018021.1 carbohydrate-binding module family 50 protein [Aaosphaeria arxii CBS 175.79]
MAPASSLILLILVSGVSKSLASTWTLPFSEHANIWHHLLQRAVVPGFPLAEQGSFSDFGLSTSCEQSLYQILKCDNYTAALADPVYHGSLNDIAMTDVVCDAGCSDSLRTIRRRVNGACASTPELFPGYPVIALIDSIWGGWNETCIKDPESGKYCNDVIESWSPVDDFKALPKDQLCSTCQKAKLAAMQLNPFGVYDSTIWKERYDYVVKTCALTGIVTTPTPSTIRFNSTEPDGCAKEDKYISRVGDTCDSIAQSNRVSSGTLYEINPSLIDCSSVGANLALCLPPRCEKLYQVKPSDNCTRIASLTDISWLNIISWNGMVDPWCSNIYGAQPSWGSTICVSPPGGAYNHTPGNGTGGGVGGPGGNGDGYAKEVVLPPAGSVLATNTTRSCGLFYTVQAGDTCRGILINSNTPSDLFLAINPSLGTADTCNSKLTAGLTYCLQPVKNWNDPLPISTPTPSPTRPAVSTSLSKTASTSARSSSKLVSGSSGFSSKVISTSTKSSARPASATTRSLV